MTRKAKIKQLANEYFETAKKIFAASHPAHNSPESEVLVDKANLQVLNNRQSDCLYGTLYLLNSLGKSSVSHQLHNIILNGVPSSDSTAVCNQQQMLEHIESGNQDSYYRCLAQLYDGWTLILERDDKANPDNTPHNIPDAIIHTKQFDRFHIVGHPEFSRLLNEYFQTPRDMFRACHESNTINFEQIDALTTKRLDHFGAIADYLNVRSKGGIVEQLKYTVSNNIPDCNGNKISEYFWGGYQAYYICLDQHANRFSGLLEESGFLMHDHNNATETANTHTSDEL